ncbi:LTR Retrotransposon [Trachipleistophora hominis]|uniref:LTR Retrotransposon n=1 Tax=Trachipleistophora hominis TaxID=72359 RepID=L7JX50_TRAHO|nr:LTR Retrotransposon [Trachipleistophora hominis]
MKRIVETTTGSNNLTVLDLKEGYYEIEIEEADKHKTAFEFGNNVYEWCGIVMGFKNAPMIFQRVIN